MAIAAKKKRVQRPGYVNRWYLAQHCSKRGFGQIDERRPEESMGETAETLDPQDKRRQSAILHQVLALQAGERKAEANGLAGFHGEENKRASEYRAHEMFITHLLNSLPQAEYEGVILVIKERLRGGTCDLSQVEQLLENKYLSMKFVKGWEEEEDDYALFASPAKKKGQKKQFKGRCGYCGEIGHKAANCPDKKSKKKEDSQDKSDKQETQKPKKNGKGKGKTDMSKIKCYNFGEMGHFARDCPKPRENANIARESEQNRHFGKLMDFGDSCVCEECAMICTDAYSDEEYESVIVYGDQGISTTTYYEETYQDLLKSDSDEESIVKYNVALCVKDSVSLEKK